METQGEQLGRIFFLNPHVELNSSLLRLPWALLRVKGETWLIPSEKHTLLFTLACHTSEATEELRQEMKGDETPGRTPAILRTSAGFSAQADFKGSCERAKPPGDLASSPLITC